MRFQERRSLVVPTARTHGGYRHYDQEALRRLRFIRRAARLGFTLTEVEQLLTASTEPDVGEVVTGKVAEIEQRMRDLDRVRLALLDVAENGVRGQCPVAAALSDWVGGPLPNPLQAGRAVRSAPSADRPSPAVRTRRLSGTGGEREVERWRR